MAGIMHHRSRLMATIFLPMRIKDLQWFIPGKLMHSTGLNATG